MYYCKKSVLPLFAIFAFLICVDSFSIGPDGIEACYSPENKNKEAELSIPWVLNQGLMDADILAHAGLFNGNVTVGKNGEINYAISSVSANNKAVFFREYPVEPVFKGPFPEYKTRAKISYFCGNDSSRWQKSIPSYRQINFGEIYDRIELKLRAHANNIEKIFFVHPGADPENIGMRLEGIDRILLTDDGELEVAGQNGYVRFTKPVAYQEISGRKKGVEVAYRIHGNEYGFNLGDYDRKHTLIIDPLLASTYIGGSQREGGENNQGFDMTIDNDGNIFVIGMTTSLDFPISGGYCSGLNGNYDIFISKFNNDLTELLASTYIGGSDYEESWGIAIDNFGNVFAAGITSSIDFPYVSGSSYDSTYAGSSDAFVVKLSNDLSTLLGATYLGGTGVEQRNSMILDEPGNVLIGGMTGSLNFPTTAGSYNESYNGGQFDFYVSRFNNDLTSLEASTYLGGLNHELWPDIEVDLYGNIFIAGATGSYNYPFTSGVYDDEFNGSHSYSYWNLDIVISKFNNELSDLLASTCIGSPDYEGSQFLKLDASGHVYVSGHTWSSGYPVTVGTYDDEFSGDEYFITKLDNNLTGLIASTFSSPGTSSEASLWGVAIDNQGYIYTTGVVWEGNFLTTDNAYDRTYNGGPYDGIIIKFNPDLTAALYASYFGGGGDEIGAAIVLDNDGNAYISGTTASTDLPIEGGVFGTYNGGTSDCFAAKFTFDQFTRITEGPHVNDADHTSGVCWIDYDNDNYLDLFLVTHWPDIVGPPLPYHYLYHNNGDGTFTSVNKLEVIGSGIEGYGASCADYDNDGDVDILVANFKMDPCFLYVNDGSGNFTVDSGSGISAENAASSSPVWIDYDLNGLLDLFIGNASDDNLDGYDPYFNYLYRDVGGIFTKIVSGEIVTDAKHTYSATWSDYDNDGDPDLFTSSHLMDGNDLYRNDGNGNFTSMTGSVLSGDAGYCFSSSWADYDNDGDMDLYVGNIGGEPFLYSNNGDATFTKISGHGLQTDGGTASQGVWGDYDNDGDLDIFITRYNTDYPQLSQGYLFENQGGNTFNKVTDGIIASDTHVVIGAAWGDYDRDGDLDLYTGRFDPSFTGNPVYSKNRLYRNNGNGNNWITIKLEGTNSNRSAIGSKIRLKADINDTSIRQMREIASQTGSSVQQALEAHFGLGDANIVDSIKIEWPSGMVDVYTDVNPDQFITYTETVCGDADGNFNVNLLDITYLISYLYKGGPDPVHMQAADPDGNGTTNILDITYLIAFLYKGGTKPVCQ